MLTEEAGCIPRFDAATILNRHILGPGLAYDLTELVSNEHVRIVRLLWILMVQGIPDRPHRLVGNTQPG